MFACRSVPPKPAGRAAAAAGLAGLVLAFVSPCAGAAAPRELRIRFDEELGQQDLRLPGRVASRTVSFACEAHQKPVDGSRLHLVLGHSPRLQGDRSFLTVSLNHGIVRSVRLDQANEAATEIDIPLPASMIHSANEVRLAVEQIADGGAAEAWTWIGSGSYVALAYEEVATRASLRRLPLPLLDPASYRPLTLSILLPTRLSPPTLEATALVVARLALGVAPKPLGLRFVHDLKTSDPMLIVGTPAEQPQIVALPGARLAVREVAGNALLAAPAGRVLDPAAGVVGLAASPSSPPILYVTANSPEGVQRGGWALAAGEEGLDGDFSIVSGPLARRANAARAWRGYAPPEARFRLADLVGPKELIVNDESPLRLPVRATPDARFLGYGHRLRLSLWLLPGVFEHPDARIELAWNGAVLQELDVRELPRKPKLSLAVSLPAPLMRPNNELRIAWKRGSSTGLLGPLLRVDAEESELYLPRDYEAALPDLALLRFGLYPFGLRSDFSDVILVLPDRLSEELFVLAAEVSALLGRRLPSDRLGFRVRLVAALTPAERAGAHLILLRTAPQGDAFDALLPDWRRAPASPSVKGLPVLQEAASPWNPQKQVLSLRAASGAELLRAFRLLSEGGLEGLRGDTAFLAPQGPVCFALSKPRRFAEVGYLTHVDAYLRSHWLALPLVLAVVSGLLFLALRLALEHRRGARP